MLRIFLPWSGIQFKILHMLSCHVSLLNLQLLLAFLCLSWHWLFKLFLYLAASGLRCVQWGLPLPHAYSLVVVRGLSCSGPCGILVPHPWIKRSCPASQGRFLREVLTLPLFEGYTCYLVECPSVWICLGSPHEKIQVSTILYPSTLTEKTNITGSFVFAGVPVFPCAFLLSGSFISPPWWESFDRGWDNHIWW